MDFSKEAAKTSLYIHVPFCLKKCPYCDFFSLPVDQYPIDGYADLLVSHLELIASRQPEQPVFESIFFGGGTPSLLPPADIERLLNAADRLIGLTGDVEISLEANPGTVNYETLVSLRSAGINRLSLGVQSLCESKLQLLGRQHSAAEAENAIRSARQAGFANLSCDLMFALPGQSIEDLQADLQRLLEYKPEHLSIYGLSIEKGTPFALLQERGDLELPDEEVYVAGYRLLHQQLAESGYQHYEISSFARPGFECRHNLRYWKRRSNLALGAGAHSFDDSGWGARWAVADSLETYADNLAAYRSPATLIESFDQAGAMAETLYLGLRTAEGVDADNFQSRFATTVEDVYPEAVRKCGDRLSCHDGFWRLNIEGWLLYDSLLMHFL